jgi:hypothetical protein
MAFQDQDKTYADKPETRRQNNTNNQNKRNNALTDYFDKLLKSTEFHTIMISLLGGGVLCVIGILLFIIIKLCFCGSISDALELLYKIGVPMIAFLMFIIKFGDKSYKGD